MSLDEILAAADRLDEPSLDQLLQQVSLLRARRKAPLLSPEESGLLQQINQGLPDEIDRRSQALREKSQNGTITAAEYTEFGQVNGLIEQLAAKRIEALIKLSELRQVPFMQLIDDLGIQGPTVYTQGSNLTQPLTNRPPAPNSGGARPQRRI
jgi:hypothetical protein